MLDISANDYTVYIHGIPKEIEAKNENYKEDLLEFFSKNTLEEEVIYRFNKKFLIRNKVPLSYL